MKGAITTVVLAITTAGLVIAILGDGRDVVSVQKPVRESIVFVDYAVPPLSAPPGQLLREAAAVIVARYTGKHRPILRGTPERFIPSTAYEFETVEVLKRHPLLPTGGRIDVKLVGGHREFRTHIERTSLVGAAPLRPDHTYVVFFDRNRVRPELYLAWAAESLYDITGSMVEPVERRRRRHENLTVDAFLDMLRTAK